MSQKVQVNWAGTTITQLCSYLAATLKYGAKLPL